MSKTRYNRLRDAALLPEAQAANAEYQRTYHSRPEVIAARAHYLSEEIARKASYVRAVTAKFIADHPVMAKGITLDLPWRQLADALYHCSAEASGKIVVASGTVQSIGHGSLICDVDPRGLQGAWMAADWLAKQAVDNA